MTYAIYPLRGAFLEALLIARLCVVIAYLDFIFKEINVANNYQIGFNEPL